AGVEATVGTAVEVPGALRGITRDDAFGRWPPLRRLVTRGAEIHGGLELGQRFGHARSLPWCNRGRGPPAARWHRAIRVTLPGMRLGFEHSYARSEEHTSELQSRENLVC